MLNFQVLDHHHDEDCSIHALIHNFCTDKQVEKMPKYNNIMVCI